MPLIEMLTTAGETRAARSAKDSGAAPAEIGASSARPERIARRARRKPIVWLQKKNGGTLAPRRGFRLRTRREETETYFAGSFGLPATVLPVPSGVPATKLLLPSGLPATKLPEPSGLPATKLPVPCGPVF